MLMGVQVRVIVMLMPRVPTVCFCVGLLLHSGSLQRKRKNKDTLWLIISASTEENVKEHVDESGETVP